MNSIELTETDKELGVSNNTQGKAEVIERKALFGSKDIDTITERFMERHGLAVPKSVDFIHNIVQWREGEINPWDNRNLRAEEIRAGFNWSKKRKNLLSDWVVNCFPLIVHATNTQRDFEQADKEYQEIQNTLNRNKFTIEMINCFHKYLVGFSALIVVGISLGSMTDLINWSHNYIVITALLLMLCTTVGSIKNFQLSEHVTYLKKIKDKYEKRSINYYTGVTKESYDFLCKSEAMSKYGFRFNHFLLLSDQSSRLNDEFKSHIKEFALALGATVFWGVWWATSSVENLLVAYCCMSIWVFVATYRVIVVNANEY